MQTRRAASPSTRGFGLTELSGNGLPRPTRGIARNIDAKLNVSRNKPPTITASWWRDATASTPGLAASLVWIEQRIIGESDLVDVIGCTARFDDVHVYVLSSVSSGVARRTDGVKGVAAISAGPCPST